MLLKVYIFASIHNLWYNYCTVICKRNGGIAVKARRFITQFYRILPTKAIDSQYVHKKVSKKLYEFDENKPYSRIHDEHPLKCLVWTGSYGRVLLYAVRMVDTYILSINGRCKLYSRATDIYKALVGKNVIPNNPHIAERFKNYHMLDLEDLAFFANAECSAASMDSSVDLIQLPSYDWVIRQEDIHVDQLGKVAMRSYIPLLHEDRILIELFLETKSITSEQLAELKREGFKEFESSYAPSDGAIQELLADLGYF